MAAEDGELIAVDLAGVSFGHPLTRSAAYHLAPTAARREAHEVIARASPDHATAHRATIAREPSEALAAELGDVADRVRAVHGHVAAAGRMQQPS